MNKKTCVIAQSLSFIEVTFVIHDVYVSDMLTMTDSADQLLDWLEGTGTYYLHSEVEDHYDAKKEELEFSVNKVLRIFL